LLNIMWRLRLLDPLPDLFTTLLTGFPMDINGVFLHPLSHWGRFRFASSITSLIQGCSSRLATARVCNGACSTAPWVPGCTMAPFHQLHWGGFTREHDTVSLMKSSLAIDCSFLNIICFRDWWIWPDLRVIVKALWSEAKRPTSHDCTRLLSNWGNSIIRCMKVPSM